MASIEPQLWLERAGEAVGFYQRAFDATVLHRVGEGDDIVVQLAVGDAAFWISSANASMNRLSPSSLGAATSRLLLVVDDPEAVMRSATDAGAVETSAVQDEHGWRLGRIVDPYGHEWEIGHPRGMWPPG